MTITWVLRRADVQHCRVPDRITRSTLGRIAIAGRAWALHDRVIRPLRRRTRACAYTQDEEWVYILSGANRGDRRREARVVPGDFWVLAGVEPHNLHNPHPRTGLPGGGNAAFAFATITARQRRYRSTASVRRRRLLAQGRLTRDAGNYQRETKFLRNQFLTEAPAK